jgi:hypothetical protein
LSSLLSLYSLLPYFLYHSTHSLELLMREFVTLGTVAQSTSQNAVFNFIPFAFTPVTEPLKASTLSIASLARARLALAVPENVVGMWVCSYHSFKRAVHVLL